MQPTREAVSAREKIRADAEKMAAAQGLDMTPGSVDYRLFYSFVDELAGNPKHEFRNKPFEEQVRWAVNKVKAARPVAPTLAPAPATPPPVAQEAITQIPAGKPIWADAEPRTSKDLPPADGWRPPANIKLPSRETGWRPGLLGQVPLIVVILISVIIAVVCLILGFMSLTRKLTIEDRQEPKSDKNESPITLCQLEIEDTESVPTQEWSSTLSLGTKISIRVAIYIVSFLITGFVLLGILIGIFKLKSDSKYLAVFFYVFVIPSVKKYLDKKFPLYEEPSPLPLNESPKCKQKSKQERSEPIEKQEREVSEFPVEGKEDRTLKNLNLMQKRIMLAGVAVIMLMGLFPPWIQTTTTTATNSGGIYVQETRHTTTVDTAAGYYFLSNAPWSSDDKKVYVRTLLTYRLDFGRLLIQWFFVSLSTAALMFYFKE
jgi:hypothetical protein